MAKADVRGKLECFELRVCICVFRLNLCLCVYILYKTTCFLGRLRYAIKKNYEIIRKNSDFGGTSSQFPKPLLFLQEPLNHPKNHQIFHKITPRGVPKGGGEAIWGIMLVFLLFLLYESKSELSNNLLAQAFVAIATSSGARKRKTMYLGYIPFFFSACLNKLIRSYGRGRELTSCSTKDFRH